jgi:hypothetical protein
LGTEGRQQHRRPQSVSKGGLTATIIKCVGSGEFGDVYRAKWHGSFVAAKILKRSDEIALGDFRTEASVSI